MKSKILTITMNPSIDKSTSVDCLLAEKKLKCSEPKSEPGGGGINVSRVIKRLGNDTIAAYLSGGYNGKLLKQLLIKENIKTKAITCFNNTRENLNVFDQKNKLQYRFLMPSATIFENEWKKLISEIERVSNIEYLVCSGSIPIGIPDDILRTIYSIAKMKKIKLIVDSSGNPLKEIIKDSVYLLKPNINELSSLIGKETLSTNDATSLAKSFVSKGICEIMVISLGEEGALLIEKESVHKISPPSIIKLSTVGAGDSMVAGIVSKLADKKEILEAVKYGVACGTAAAMNQGTELCYKADADQLFLNISSTEIV